MFVKERFSSDSLGTKTWYRRAAEQRKEYNGENKMPCECVLGSVIPYLHPQGRRDYLMSLMSLSLQRMQAAAASLQCAGIEI